jgi:hypothetical protein
MFRKGGQRRTIEAGCGWRCFGHPNEVDKKYLRHRRYCSSCKENADELPKFNREAGLINGWKGNTNRHQKPNQILTMAVVDGVRQDILLDGVSSIDDALYDAKLVAALEEERVVPLSKSQKKRQKKKAKKEAEDTL